MARHALLLVAAALIAASPALATPAHEACSGAIAAEERRRPDLPRGLLHAIAMVESSYRPAGRGAAVPWPWTINSPAGSFYLPSRTAAVAKVEELRAAGHRNIDVGCMQVNLMHHPTAFASLHAAFDPTTNVRYAAAFLTDLHDTAPSLFDAVARYHSHTEDLGTAYADRVFALWGRPSEAGRSRHGLGAPASPRLIESLARPLTGGARPVPGSASPHRPLTARGAGASPLEPTGPRYALPRR